MNPLYLSGHNPSSHNPTISITCLKPERSEEKSELPTPKGDNKVADTPKRQPDWSQLNLQVRHLQWQDLNKTGKIHKTNQNQKVQNVITEKYNVKKHKLHRNRFHDFINCYWKLKKNKKTIDYGKQILYTGITLLRYRIIQ